MLPYSKPSSQPLSENRFALYEFGGGLNNIESDVIIADNESSNNQNMMFLSAKLMEKRYGTSLVDNFVCGDVVEGITTPSPIIWVDEYKSNGAPTTFIKATLDNLYVNNVNVFELSGGGVSGVNYLNKYYLVDGSDIIVYDGATALYIRQDVSTKLHTATVIGGNIMVLNEIDVRTKVGDFIQIETSNSYESFYITAIDVPTKTITLNTAIRLAHAVGDFVRMYVPNPKASITQIISTATAIGATTMILNGLDYRIQVGFTITTQDTSSDTRTITEINRATNTITFTAMTYAHAKDVIVKFNSTYFTGVFNGKVQIDTVNKITWYEPCDFELDTDFLGENTVPKNPSVILVHNDRLFLSGNTSAPHEIYMSDISNQLYFPVFTGLQIAPTGDKIWSMAVFDNALVVARNKDMYVIRGNSPDASQPDPFKIDKMDTHIGMISNNCYAILNNFMFYLGFDKKFYKCTSPNTYVEYLMTAPLTRKVDVTLEPLSLTSFSTISAVAFNNHYAILIDDKIIVYSYDNQAFTYFTGIGASCLYTDGVNLYFGKTNGTFAKYDSTVRNDCGIAYEAIYETKRFDFKNSMNYKYYKNCLTSSHAWDEFLSEIDVYFEIDNFNTKTPKVVNSNQSKFGVAVWGDRFNDRHIYRSGLMNLDYRGRSIKIIIKNNKLNQAMRLYDFNIIYLDRDVR